MTSQNPAVPQLPGGPDPGQPVPRTPVDGFDLAAYAQIAVQIASGAEPRATVLARAGLDEARWLTVEKTWLLRIATAVLQGDPSLTHEHDAASRAAEAALAPPEPPMPLEVYAAIVEQIEAGRAPAEVLAGAGIALGEFVRHQRAWTARIAADRRLASSFRALVASAKEGRG